MNNTNQRPKSAKWWIPLVWGSGMLALLALLSLAILTSADSPPVSVEKEAQPETISPSSMVQYTAEFSNTSDADVALVVISDTLPTGFAFLGMGAGSDIGDEPAGSTGTIIWTGPYTIAAHSELELIYDVWSGAPISLTPYENSLVARLSTGEIIGASAAVTVVGISLTGDKWASADQVYVGEAIDYTVVFTNNGNLDAHLAAITDTLPTGFAFSHMVTGTLPTPDIQGSTLIWSGPLTVTAGGELHFSYQVTAGDTTGQGYVNQVRTRYGNTSVGPFEAPVTVLRHTAYVYLPLIYGYVPVEPPPAGYLLAFDSKPGDNYEIFVGNDDGTDQRNISNLAGGDLEPTWSGDGTRVAWVHYDADRGEIYAANLDGSGRVNLTNNPKDDRNADWSPDSSKIVFDSYRDGRYEIYVMNPDGSNQTRLTNRPCQSHEPLWSPDGTRIAFICGLNDYAEIYVMDADGSNQTRLTDNLLEETALDWAPDSIRIAYLEPVTNKNPEIYVVNANTGVSTRLTDNSYYEFAPDWSPDGTLIAFSSNRSGNYEIWTMSDSGANPTNLTQATGADYVPKWSPDGTKISFISARDGNKELYVMNADGSDQLRLTNTAQDESEHAWQPVIP
jgi:uncharacterized repeat protein (TIGR01451 family)